MRCRECKKEFSGPGKLCPQCKAEAPKVTPDEEAFVAEMLKNMDPATTAEFADLMGKCKTEDEFINAIFVGPCPKCGSEETDDCEDDPEIDNLCVGKCLKCGHLWCTECEKPLTKAAHDCPCLEEEIEL
jgi:hypothetical protein